MKKIFTLSAVCMILGAASAQAQSFTVYSHGEEVADGATINVKGEITETDYGAFLYRSCLWDPELVVKATGSVKGSVELSPAGDGWTICWPEQCKSVAAGKSRTEEGIFTAGGANLQIHNQIESYDEELQIPESNSAKVVITAGDQTVTLTLVNEAPEASVDNIAASTSAPVYYNLQGQKVANPEHGVFIRIAGGKATKVVK